MTDRYDVVIRTGRMIGPDGERSGSVAISDGRIAAVLPYGPFDRLRERGPDAERMVDLAGDEVLMPGIVDSHVHVNEPGRTDWEGFDHATQAAAAGGVTTIIDMPLNSIPPTTTPEALAVKREAANPYAKINIGFWGGAVPENLGTLAALHEAGVFGFKCFLSPSGVDEFGHLSPLELHRAQAELAEFDGLLIVHAEDPEQLDSAPAIPGREYHDFVLSRPDRAEVTAIERVIAGLRQTGGRAHILHLSSAAALPAIRAAKAEGLRLSVETCPHYLVFAAEEIGAGATQFKCCPPIRDQANSDLLWQALLDGTIDLIASDHSPSTAALKLAGNGDFQVAWGGISGLQVSFPAVWSAARERGISLSRVSQWMSAGTSKLVGLQAHKGSLAVGMDADMIIFAPDSEWQVQAPALLHRNKISAYDGKTLHGAVRQTWVAGQPITTEGPPAGVLLSARS